MPEPIHIRFSIYEESSFNWVRCRNNYTHFSVKTRNPILHIGLFTEDDNDDDSQQENPKYTLVLYANNLKIENIVLLRKEGKGLADVKIKEQIWPFVFSSSRWSGFWIYFSDGTFAFGQERECAHLMSWCDIKCNSIKKVGFKLQAYENEPVRKADIVVDVSARNQPYGVKWTPCSYGEVPPNAFIGGEAQGSQLYVVRAMIKGSVTPGKLRDNSEYAEVSWGGREHRMHLYEVLTDFEGEWVKSHNDKIPPLALLAGRAEDDTPLYIGRTQFQETLTVGKVQPSHRALYIPFAGEEVAFKEFEVLCHKLPGLPAELGGSPEAPRSQPQAKWVYSCNGRVPRNAFMIGHHENQAILLIRVEHQGLWYPGWMCPGDSPEGHVAGTYFFSNVPEYEVLCDFNGYWEKIEDDYTIPENAFLIGNDSDDGDMYIGRAWHEGRQLCGPIINMICEICYDDQSIEKSEFEVLCYPNPVESAVKNGLREGQSR